VCMQIGLSLSWLQQMHIARFLGFGLFIGSIRAILEITHISITISSTTIYTICRTISTLHFLFARFLNRFSPFCFSHLHTCIIYAIDIHVI